MPYIFQFFVTGDDLSKSMIRVIDDVSKLLAKRFGSKYRASSRDYAAYVLASNEAVVEPEPGSREILRVETYFILNIYQEELKARFDIPRFPAARVGGRGLFGKDALQLASDLRSVLERSLSASDRELAAEIGKLVGGERAEAKPTEPRVSLESPPPMRTVEPAVRAVSRMTSRLTEVFRSLVPPSPAPAGPKEAAEPEIKPALAPGGGVEAPSFERNVLRAGIMDCLAKLEKLRGEGRISEEAYRRMRETYLFLLG